MSKTVTKQTASVKTLNQNQTQMLNTMRKAGLLSPGQVRNIQAANDPSLQLERELDTSLMKHDERAGESRVRIIANYLGKDRQQRALLSEQLRKASLNLTDSFNLFDSTIKQAFAVRAGLLSLVELCGVWAESIKSNGRSEHGETAVSEIIATVEGMRELCPLTDGFFRDGLSFLKEGRERVDGILKSIEPPHSSAAQ